MGEPFVGETGSLLRATLRRVGLPSNKGAYMNVVSCWPKVDHNPKPHHIEACKDNFYAQLALLEDTRPVLVCGRVAIETMMPRVNPARARGRIIPWRGRHIFPVYHPSYIARAGQFEYLQWKRQLAVFKSFVYADGEELYISPQDCLYCGRPVTELIDGLVYLCPKHIKKFRKDTEWHGSDASVTQTTLFELPRTNVSKRGRRSSKR